MSHELCAYTRVVLLSGDELKNITDDNTIFDDVLVKPLSIKRLKALLKAFSIII